MSHQLLWPCFSVTLLVSNPEASKSQNMLGFIRYKVTALTSETQHKRSPRQYVVNGQDSPTILRDLNLIFTHQKFQPVKSLKP